VARAAQWHAGPVLIAALADRLEVVRFDVDATREQIEAAVASRVAEVRALREQAEKDEREASEAVARVTRDYTTGALRADVFNELRPDLNAELEAASAKLARLRDQDREVTERGELRDVEEHTLRRLAELRHEIAGRVNGAPGFDGVRAALLQLFEGFTLHRATSDKAPKRVQADLAWLDDYVIEPHVRSQLVEGYSENMTPILRRKPLQGAENNSYMGLPLYELFGPIHEPPFQPRTSRRRRNAALSPLGGDTRQRPAHGRVRGRVLGTDYRVRKEPDESVWLPLRSIASTSHLYAVRRWRNPLGTAMRVTDRGRYMLSPSFPIMWR
jgi:hypothetical protein